MTKSTHFTKKVVLICRNLQGDISSNISSNPQLGAGGPGTYNGDVSIVLSDEGGTYDGGFFFAPGDDR